MVLEKLLYAFENDDQRSEASGERRGSVQSGDDGYGSSKDQLDHLDGPVHDPSAVGVVVVPSLLGLQAADHGRGRNRSTSWV